MVVDEEEDQMLSLGNERFSVPEVLFTPTDIGQSSSPSFIALPSHQLLPGAHLPPPVDALVCSFPLTTSFVPFSLAGLPQVGIPEAIAQSIALLPEDLQGMFWSNIGVFGGSTLFPGFKERL